MKQCSVALTHLPASAMYCQRESRLTDRPLITPVEDQETVAEVHPLEVLDFTELDSASLVERGVTPYERRASHMEVQTEIVRASEMREKVFQRIWNIRTGEDRAQTQEQYERELARYEKQKGKRREITINTAEVSGYGVEIGGQTFGSITEHKIVGYFKADGVTFVPRPRKPQVADEAPHAMWWSSRRERRGGRVYPARSGGLLGSAHFNRDIRVDRVEEYEAEMRAGKWHDLLSDPIAITEDGQVLNGQHRLAALADILHPKDYEAGIYGEPGDFGDTDPAFLVIWGVDPNEALYADGSHRTAHDEKMIAVRLLSPRAA
jgi:hypothetical protein